MKKASTFQQLEADVAQANKISSKYKDKEGRSLLFVLNNPDHSPTLQRKHRAQVHNNNNNNTTSNATTSGRSTVQDTATPTPYPEGMTPHPDQDDKGTRDEPILWRLRTTISVLKHPVKLGEEQRLLNYRQFYRFYFRMREYGSIDDVTKDEIRSSVTINEFDENECVICMESRAQIALNCNHAFCERCLQQWKQRSDTCPVCRQLNSTDENDVWVLTGEPSTEDLANYFSEFLDSICK